MQFQKKLFDLIESEKNVIDINKMSHSKSNNQRYKLFIENENKLYVEYSFALTKDKPPKHKTNYKILIHKSHQTCFLCRLDINEKHTNPEFIEENYQFLLDLKFINLYNLLKEFSDEIFDKEIPHFHFYILNNERCDEWAFPIEIANKLFKFENANKYSINDIINSEIKSMEYFNEFTNILPNKNLNELIKQINAKRLIK